MRENQKLSFKEAALQILKSENEPLSAKEIVDIAFQKEFLYRRQNSRSHHGCSNLC